MKNWDAVRRWSLVGGLTLLAIGALALYLRPVTPETSWSARPDLAQLDTGEMPRVRSSFSIHNRDDAMARIDWEILRLRDVRSGRIPDNVRERELAFARELPSREDLDGGMGLTASNWVPRGPFNVGGRTRALAVDLDYNGSSNRRILAGGISGGMYRSEDAGATWNLTTALSDHASVTAVAQDPQNRSVWYYGTGEYIGNSAAGNGNFAYYGHGVFKSTNGGASWSQLASTSNNDPNAFDDFFDFVWNLAVHPTSGSIFAAVYGGILRSTDAGGSWSLVQGRGQPPYSSTSDVVIGADGAVYAALGRNGTGITEYGVYRSTTDGANWSNITPPGMNTDPNRIVLAAAPSDANTLYALVQFGNGAQASDHQLFRYNAGSGSWSNLSANIPDFNDNFGGQAGVFSSQGGYDLLVKVKPDNPNVFWLGGTNLVRSSNGGTSYDWVGGYHPQDFLYANHHPDQHSMAFLPNNPNAMVSGHDGGLSFTTNALQQPQQWTSLNNGYLTTQFYAISIDPTAGSNDILGGLQDNGTWLTESVNGTDPWVNPLGGDGAFNAIAPGGVPLYVSSQTGNAVRITFQNNQAVYSTIRPAGGQNFLFITPFFLDPNDARVMYLAEGNRVWRNSNLDGIPEGNQQPTNINWTALNNSAVSNTSVTAIGVAKTPANRVYFGAVGQNTTVLKRLDNAPSNPTGTVITPPLSTQGVYPSCIAVNPNNGDEIIAVFSNYEAESVWYSSNAGASWTNVEGNLGGQNGPSVRWAAIHPGSGGTIYYLATSVGVYSATTLSGNTTWVQEGSGVLGSVITDMILTRPADGLVVAGTHGRGVYSTTAGGGGGGAVATINISELRIEVQPGTQRTGAFTLRNTGGQPLNFTLSTSGFAASDQPTNRGMLRTDVAVDRRPLVERLGGGMPTEVSALGAAPPHAPGGSPDNPLVDVLALDDGNATPDDFVGTADLVDFYWMNEFTLGAQGYDLDEILFYMRTENLVSNTVYVGVYSDPNGTALAEGTLNLNIAPNGDWFSVTLTNPVSFAAGETFYLMIGADGFINFPAGTDFNGAVPNGSYYFDWLSSTWVNLNTVPGFTNGAFLVRASGNFSGGGNQNPTAVASVPASGTVNQTITFDGSGSFDSDGQITQYLWNFGDGSTSNQAVATHSYSQPNTYTWSLTVTDNGGATDQVTGQITISAGASRLTVNPASGTIPAGGSQLISATYDAQGQPNGTYFGTIVIGGNGGQISLPVTVFVDPSVGIGDEPVAVEGFALHPNYPNPFNPATTITYDLEKSAPVTLTVYNLRGQRVRTLVQATQGAGSYAVQWDGRDDTGRPVSSGMYVYRLQAGERVASRKMTLLQ